MSELKEEISFQEKLERGDFKVVYSKKQLENQQKEKEEQDAREEARLEESSWDDAHDEDIERNIKKEMKYHQDIADDIYHPNYLNGLSYDIYEQCWG